MKKLLKILAIILAVLILVVIGAYVWATISANGVLSQTFGVHAYELPIPFPLSDAEAAGLGEAERSLRVGDLAIERGRHLVESRYVCTECHGTNFGGGTMIDAFPIGRLLGPNITTGKGSKTINYKPADWDRIVRHGVLPSGRPAVMPSEDFKLMSDQELSDVVSYIRSRPPVDNEVAAPSFGPLGKFLLATGQIIPSASVIDTHQGTHVEQPPAAEATAVFGKHLAAICVGCHRENLAGGPIVGGDPSWVPARNLTQHPDGLAKVTYDQFLKTMREGVRADGTPIKPPMNALMPFAQKMTDVEMQALWAYLKSVPAMPTPEK
jgi:mono/diheme cytochrome c family protein